MPYEPFLLGVWVVFNLLSSPKKLSSSSLSNPRQRAEYCREYCFLAKGKYGCTEGYKRVPRSAPNKLERSLKNWELQISSFEEFLGGENVLGRVPASLPHTLGYACTFYAPTSPPPSFGRENSLSSAANSVSSARNWVSSLWHTNNRLKGTH